MTLTSDLGTSTDLPITVQIEGYRFRRQFGSDRIGYWLDAEQMSLGRNVTVKVLRPEMEAVPAAQREFLAEMDRLSQLDHPSIIRVLDTFREPPLALVTERASGTTIGDLLEPGKPLRPKPSLRMLQSVTNALAYLDGLGWAHKNLSPALIRVRSEDRCRLVTFRNIISCEEQAALKGKLAQDANYVAPEQLGGEDPVGPTTPCYQLGSLLFHMLTGRPPHQSAVPLEVARAHFKDEFPSLRRLQPFLPAAIYTVVQACTERNPAHRPDLAELGAALGTIEAGGTPGLTPKKPKGADQQDAFPQLRRRRRRRR